MSSPKEDPFDEAKKSGIWKVAVAVAAYGIWKVPAVALAAAGIGVAAWGVCKFLESIPEEPEPVDDRKKKKAPGRNGEIIWRDDFEDDPRGYFDAAARIGVATSKVSKFLESVSEEPERVDDRKKMKARNGEIIDRDDFKDDPGGYFAAATGIGAAALGVSKFLESDSEEPEPVDDRGKTKAPGRNGEIICRDDFENDPHGYFAAATGIGVAALGVSEFLESDSEEPESAEDREKTKAPAKNGEIICRDDFEDDPLGYFADTTGIGVAALGVSKFLESDSEEPEPADDREKMKAPGRNGEIIYRDDFEDDPFKKLHSGNTGGTHFPSAAGLSNPKLNSSQRKDGRRRVIFIRWKKPSQGWVGLNVDGASRGNPGPAGAGGLLRDERGLWIKGFYSNLGIANNTVAELWALIQGLKMAWDLGFKKIQVQSDSEVVLYLVRQANQAKPHWNLVDEIRSMLARNWDCRLEHVRREGNICADYLAKQGSMLKKKKGSKLKKKKGSKLEFGFKVLESPPQALTELLSNDIRGVTTPRIVKMPPKNQKNNK